jgi:hypothetical protein
MQRILAILAVLLLCLPSLPARAQTAAAKTDDGIVGTIVEIEGSATVAPPGGAAAPASVDAPVHPGDTVETGAGSKAFILFIDNTELTLSENTSTKIDEYVFDADDNRDNRARYSVVGGAFEYVSGLIGKRPDPDVKIETPVGSIGIRGTDFWAGNLDGQYGVAVNEGQVALKTDAGDEAVVNKGEGTTVADRHHAPERAKAWDPEKFRRVAATVHLKRQQWVRRRIQAMQPRQQRLRHRYRRYMDAHNLRKARRQGWQRGNAGQPQNGNAGAAANGTPDTGAQQPQQQQRPNRFQQRYRQRWQQ